MPRESLYRGFAAIDRSGNLCWGTISRREDEAQTKFDRWNPDPTGEGIGEVVVPVEIRLTKLVR